MRYFDLAGKAKIKVSDNKLTIEDIKKQAADIVDRKDLYLVREIDREEFVGNKKTEPIPVKEEEVVLGKDYVKEEDLNIDHLPTWQEIIDELRIKSTQPDYRPKNKR